MMQERAQELREQFKGFTNGVLVEQVVIFEQLLQTDAINCSILVDDALEIYDILRDECVRRICLLAQAGN